jgi:hypothetical protein
MLFLLSQPTKWKPLAVRFAIAGIRFRPQHAPQSDGLSDGEGSLSE